MPHTVLWAGYKWFHLVFNAEDCRRRNRGSERMSIPITAPQGPPLWLRPVWHQGHGGVNWIPWAEMCSTDTGSKSMQTEQRALLECLRACWGDRKCRSWAVKPDSQVALDREDSTKLWDVLACTCLCLFLTPWPSGFVLSLWWGFLKRTETWKSVLSVVILTVQLTILFPLRHWSLSAKWGAALCPIPKAYSSTRCINSLWQPADH